MRFDILTLFPEFFDSVFSVGVLSRAIEKKLLALNIHNIRDYTSDKHRMADDRPYGGGSGMILKPEPIARAIEVLKQGTDSKVVMLSPRGRVFNDQIARELSETEQIIFICGRYEGIDERIRELYVDTDISVGDYVLSGGEYAALIMIDSISRYIPSILGNESSTMEESFRDYLLEYPQYTRPEEFKGIKIPEVLLSGNHKEIANWHRKKQLEITFLNRNDLIDQTHLDRNEITELDKIKNKFSKKIKLHIALVHYPVYNKRLEVVKTSFTNIDVLDIARASKTYGVKYFYLVHPVEEQVVLMKRVVDHWTEGKGCAYNNSRKESLENIKYAASIEEVIADITEAENKKPLLISTDARYSDRMTGYREMREKLQNDDRPFLLLLGTGYGLTREIIENSDFILKPITGNNEYNHLSVRSAASIMLDRLCSVNI